MSSTVNRRQFLSGILAKQAPSDFCIPEGDSPEPSLSWHTANRLLFGPRPGDVQTIEAQGFEAFVAQQLDPQSIDDSVVEQMIEDQGFLSFSETEAELWDRVSNQDYFESARPLFETIHATWLRAVNSERQLFEKTVHFWHDHFNIFGQDFIIRSLFSAWDGVVRAHAFGNFREFLGAVATTPAMLYYLDNHVNTVSGPNENWARELFELHTLGAENYRPGIIETPTCDGTNDHDGDGFRDWYVDNDIYEAARCFTGWTFDGDSNSPTRGQFLYRADAHDRFNKFVLCQYIPDSLSEMEDGRRVLDFLANHPGTARHICGKLCRRFISDNPPQSIIDSAAALWMEQIEADDQIKRVLEHILLSEEFRAARLQKFKRPFDWAVSTMRTLGLPFINNQNFNISWFYDPMGQPTFQWRPPDGAPDTKDYWQTSNNLLGRWNFLYMTASSWFAEQGFTYDVTDRIPLDAGSAREAAEQWIETLAGREFSPGSTEAIARFIAEGRNPDLPISEVQLQNNSRFAAALCLMSPEFMWM